MSDPRPLLYRAADQIGTLVHDATPLTGPTPCEGWTVAELVAHVLAVHDKLLAARPTDVRHQVFYDSAARYATALADRRADIRARWSDDAVLDRTVDVPWGSRPGREVAQGFTQELVVHAWDLAAALDRTDELDPDLARPVLATAVRLLPAENRNARFGAPVPVDDDAGPYDRLVAWLGRDPAAARP